MQALPNAPYQQLSILKHVHSSISYQQGIYQRYDWRGCESPSGYGPLRRKGISYCSHLEVFNFTPDSGIRKSINLSGFPKMFLMCYKRIFHLLSFFLYI